MDVSSITCRAGIDIITYSLTIYGSTRTLSMSIAISRVEHRLAKGPIAFAAIHANLQKLRTIHDLPLFLFDDAGKFVQPLLLSWETDAVPYNVQDYRLVKCVLGMETYLSDPNLEGLIVL